MLAEGLGVGYVLQELLESILDTLTLDPLASAQSDHAFLFWRRARSD